MTTLTFEESTVDLIKVAYERALEKHFKIIDRRYCPYWCRRQPRKTFVLDRIWMTLANLYPSLSAGGVIYLVKAKDLKNIQKWEANE